jgi:hypothetical protein
MHKKKTFSNTCAPWNESDPFLNHGHGSGHNLYHGHGDGPYRDAYHDLCRNLSSLETLLCPFFLHLYPWILYHCGLCCVLLI